MIEIYNFILKIFTKRNLGIPTTNHTYEDCRLMLLAKKNNFPYEIGLIEFSKIKEKLG